MKSYEKEEFKKLVDELYKLEVDVPDKVIELAILMQIYKQLKDIAGSLKTML